MIYLDYNATTPVANEVVETITSALCDTWANPSSSYKLGQSAKLVVENARQMIAEMIGSAPDEIIFNSGGTEGNNAVINTAVQNFYSFAEAKSSSEKPHIITTNIEHDSIKLPLETLSSNEKADITFVPVSKISGTVSIDDIINEIRPNTCLITVMLANNETGIIQPVHLLRPKLQSFLKSSKSEKHFPIILHTDAAQAIGKIEVDVSSLDVDFLTIVGHKFYGPRIGALYFKRGTNLIPFLYGGGQERNFRPGTENTCMIAGLGKAAELVTLNLNTYNSHMLEMQNYLETCLKETFSAHAVFNVKDISRLPNTVSVALDYEGITGKSVLDECSEVLCASTGAACHSGGLPSSVLVASGVSHKLAQKTLRLSIGRETTQMEIKNAVKYLEIAVKRLNIQ